MANLNSEKWKKSSFYEEKSLVGLTPEAKCYKRKTRQTKTILVTKSLMVRNFNLDLINVSI